MNADEEHGVDVAAAVSLADEDNFGGKIYSDVTRGSTGLAASQGQHPRGRRKSGDFVVACRETALPSGR